MEYNESERKITVKVVYYGPALSGKTTNLIHLHGFLNPSSRGDLMSLDTKGDRTLFFDLLPIGVRTGSNVRIKFKVFTVPGQVAHDATRKAVLSRADGVVFVADSQRSQAVNNSESFENLEKNANRTGLDFETLPLVVQFNKRDLGQIISEDEVRKLWGPTGIEVVFSSAVLGYGVVETFEMILIKVYRYLELHHPRFTELGITEREFVSVLQPDNGG